MSKVSKVETPKHITVKLAAQYPAFNLCLYILNLLSKSPLTGVADPSVYPYFDLWPAIDQPRMVPLPKPSSKAPPKPSTTSTQSRLTHSELHAMVMMERIGSSGSFGSFETSKSAPTNGVKTHDDLHRAVFPDGAVETPSGTPHTRYVDLPSPTTSFADELIARRRMSTYTRLPLPTSPSPSRRLPATPPSPGARLSSAFESALPRDFEQPRLRVSPVRAPLSRFPQDLEPRQGLARSSSLMRPTSLAVPELSDKLNRSNSLSTISQAAPRKRDSMVQQRLSMETLAKFPAPPVPVPRAPVPKPLDRSKYTFQR
ncbi:hypothetical protein DXG03_000383 [Asterophora parasitica]|uniref:Uncharacterized protein n=1 Tax=Asterophora parasitica TaxID=117018 RepID=A0A9P7KGV3_9AGAR|nr:hypothetical protein DXG03_000383 [Asterophora parasitica]